MCDGTFNGFKGIAELGRKKVGHCTRFQDKVVQCIMCGFGMYFW